MNGYRTQIEALIGLKKIKKVTAWSRTLSLRILLHQRY
jgi:hypothetical protein